MLSNNKLILNSILAFSFLSLAIAYFIQYILGHEPCNLCLIERVPYLASLVFISLIFILNKSIGYDYGSFWKATISGKQGNCEG